MKFLLIICAFFVGSLVPATLVHADQSDAEKASEYKADDSGKNKRDSNPNELTAQDQSNGKNDVETTRLIRLAITKEKTLSTSAHNVKIIVAKNSVTLKGPVKTPHERTVIEAKAHSVAPNMSIVNELEIAH